MVHTGFHRHREMGGWQGTPGQLKVFRVLQCPDIYDDYLILRLPSVLTKPGGIDEPQTCTPLLTAAEAAVDRQNKVIQAGSIFFEKSILNAIAKIVLSNLKHVEVIKV